jgi:uncharacterized membrane protein
MLNILKTGRIIFAVGIAGLGFLCIIDKDFIIGRPSPWNTLLPDWNPALAYISGVIVIVSAFAIILNKQAKNAALLIALLIMFLTIPREFLDHLKNWLSAYKSLALLGGALIIASSYELNKKKSAYILWAGTICLSAFFIAAGYAHFKYDDFTKNYIPAYLPFHGFFTYFCAVCLIAGGIGILIPATRKWAALLSGIMLTGWFFLLHLPKFFADVNNKGERMGVFESLTLAGVFFVAAFIFTLIEQKRILGKNNLMVPENFIS